MNCEAHVSINQDESEDIKENYSSISRDVVKGRRAVS